MKLTLLHVVLLVALLSSHATIAMPAGCSMGGCQPNLSFDSQTALPFKHPPGLSWATSAVHAPQGIDSPGCASNGAIVACNAYYFPTKENSVVVFDASTGKILWYNNGVNSPETVPLVGFNNWVISAGSDRIAAWDDTGSILWSDEFEPKADVLNPQIADNGLVFLSFTDGHIATYTTNGIPHASYWLNATVQGVNGVFVPMGQPACDGGHRFFVFGRFSSNNASLTSVGRVWAFDVHSTVDRRISLAWTLDVSLSCMSSPRSTLFVNVNNLVIIQSLVGRGSIVVQAVTNNNPPKIVFSTPVPYPVKQFALDPRDQSIWLRFEGFSSLLWRLDSASGKILQQVDVAAMLNDTGMIITSQVTLGMQPSAAGVNDDQILTMVFIAQNNSGLNHIVGLSFTGNDAAILYARPTGFPDDFNGQLAVASTGMLNNKCTGFHECNPVDDAGSTSDKLDLQMRQDEPSSVAPSTSGDHSNTDPRPLVVMLTADWTMALAEWPSD